MSARSVTRREFARLAGAAGLVAWVPGRLLAQAPATEDTRNPLAVALDDLVAANRILANEGVIDAFGHVSCRHPLRPAHFLMSRARAPALVEASDIMEFDGEGKAVDAVGRRPYAERFIHAAIFVPIALPTFRSGFFFSMRRHSAMIG